MTKPHSDECRACVEELMQHDEDTLVQQRLHADRLRRGSTVVEASKDEHPDVEMAQSGLLLGAAERHLVTKAHESPREQEWRLREVLEKLSSLGQENPCKRRQKMPKRDKV